MYACVCACILYRSLCVYADAGACMHVCVCVCVCGCVSAFIWACMCMYSQASCGLELVGPDRKELYDEQLPKAVQHLFLLAKHLQQQVINLPQSQVSSGFHNWMMHHGVNIALGISVCVCVCVHACVHACVCVG